MSNVTRLPSRERTRCVAPIDDDGHALCGCAAAAERLIDGVLLPLCPDHLAELDAETQEKHAMKITYRDLESGDLHEMPGETLVLAGAHGDEDRTGLDLPHDAESVVGSGGFYAEDAATGDVVYVYDSVTGLWWRSRITVGADAEISTDNGASTRPVADLAEFEVSAMVERAHAGDDDVREAAHAAAAKGDEREFLAAYALEHARRHGAPWVAR